MRRFGWNNKQSHEDLGSRWTISYQCEYIWRVVDSNINLFMLHALDFYTFVGSYSPWDPQTNSLHSTTSHLHENICMQILFYSSSTMCGGPEGENSNLWHFGRFESHVEVVTRAKYLNRTSKYLCLCISQTLCWSSICLFVLDSL